MHSPSVRPETMIQCSSSFFNGHPLQIANSRTRDVRKKMPVRSDNKPSMMKEGTRSSYEDLGCYQWGRQAPGKLSSLRVQASVAHLEGHPKDCTLVKYKSPSESDFPPEPPTSFHLHILAIRTSSPLPSTNTL